MTIAQAPGGIAPLQHGTRPSLGQDLSAALRFTRGALAAGWRSLLLPGAVYLAISMGLMLAVRLAAPDAAAVLEETGTAGGPIDAPDVPLQGAIDVISGVALLVISLLWTSACYRLGRDLIEGQAGPASRYFSGSFATVLTIIFYGLACVAGSLLLIIPGLIAMFGLGLSIAAAANGSEHPFRDSWKLAGRRLGTVILALLLTAVLETLANGSGISYRGGYLQGGILPLLVAPPVALFLTCIFERASGRDLPNLSARTARSAA